jgi:hypothetical protein
MFSFAIVFAWKIPDSDSLILFPIYCGGFKLVLDSMFFV